MCCDEENGPRKCRYGQLSLNCLEPPLVTQRPACCSVPSQLLDTLLECKVLSWLFNASLSLGTAEQSLAPNCLDHFVQSGLLEAVRMLAPLPSDLRPHDQSALSNGWLEPYEDCLAPSYPLVLLSAERFPDATGRSKSCWSLCALLATFLAALLAILITRSPQACLVLSCT